MHIYSPHHLLVVGYRWIPLYLILLITACIPLTVKVNLQNSLVKHVKNPLIIDVSIYIKLHLLPSSFFLHLLHRTDISFSHHPSSFIFFSELISPSPSQNLFFRTPIGKNSVYVVFKGKKTGVFSSWPECHEQVVGFPGASYKKFNSTDEAYQAISRRSVHSSHSCPESSVNVTEKVSKKSESTGVMLFLFVFVFILGVLVGKIV